MPNTLAYLAPLCYAGDVRLEFLIESEVPGMTFSTLALNSPVVLGMVSPTTALPAYLRSAVFRVTGCTAGTVTVNGMEFWRESGMLTDGTTTIFLLDPEDSVDARYRLVTEELDALELDKVRYEGTDLEAIHLRINYLESVLDVIESEIASL